jgi:hypothetical protein
MYTAADLARARAHVVVAEARIARQRELIGGLDEGSPVTAEAERFLELMLDLYRQVVRHGDDNATEVEREVR